MPVPYAKDESQFNQLVQSHRYLVAYFTASWCGPCQAVAPIIEEIYSNAAYNKIQIVKIDIDANQRLAGKFEITSVPTFVFFEAGKETDRLRGASNQIKVKIDELNSKAVADPQSTERSIEAPVGNSESYAEIKELIPKGFEVLNPTIHTGETIALNVLPHQDGGDVRDVFKIDAKNSGVYTDADSEALFFVPLNNISKVYSVLLKVVKPQNVKVSDLHEDVLQEECQMPNSLKIWPNKPSIMSFDETSSLDAPHMSKIEISEDSEWVEVKLRYVRFQNVQNLNIRVTGEDEDSHTLIEKIVLVGVSGENKEQGSVHQEED